MLNKTMLLKIKIFFSHKKILIFFAGIICLSLLMPAKATSAGIWDWLGVSGMATAVPALIISVVIFVFGAISAFFAGFAGMVLSFVLSPAFTELSFTNPATNPIIKMGLGVTQGLANIILVLILIYIALATILRLAGYETKKLLVRFVVIALLVNFTPVLCGLIVDASNIIMNYFAQPLIGSGGLSSLVTHIKDMWSSISGGFDFQLLGKSIRQVDFIFKLLTATIFYFFLAIILLLFSAVFAIRYIAIWILVILSPMAFVCLALPKGSPIRRGWDMWWEQFIQWSMIGITAMFFLYLGIQFMVQGPNLFHGTLGPADLGWFTLILQYAVPMAFLYLGWIMAQQTSAFGAQQTIGLTKKYGKKGGVWAGGEARRAAGRVAGARGKEGMQKLAATPLPGFKGKSFGGKLVTGLGYATGVAPAYWALRRGVGEAGTYLTEAGRKDIRGAEKKYEGTTAANKVSAMRDVRVGWSNRVAALNQAIEENQIKDIKYDKLKNPTGIRDDEITKIGTAALRTHPEEFKKIRDTFPQLAENMGEKFTEKTKTLANVNLKEALDKGYTGVTERIIAEMKTTQVPKMDSSILYGGDAKPEAKAAAYKFWQGGHWAEAGKSFGREFCDEVRKDFEASPKSFTSSAKNYFESSPAGKSLYGIQESKKPKAKPAASTDM